LSYHRQNLTERFPLCVVIAGKETAKVSLQHNAKVYIACRSAEKARAATEELKSVTGKTDDDLKVLSMDLSNLATIKVAVDEFVRWGHFTHPIAALLTRRITPGWFGFTTDPKVASMSCLTQPE